MNIYVYILLYDLEFDVDIIYISNLFSIPNSGQFVNSFDNLLNSIIQVYLCFVVMLKNIYLL